MQTEPANIEFLPQGVRQCICLGKVTKAALKQIIEAARQLHAQTPTGLILVKFPDETQTLKSEAELTAMLN